ncbi:TniQ family protein [Pseudomonas viridiflava]|uniref:TniQ family protein n=1 Tax=Pseudomonas viridiflava TaxID=33069 RepID=UPI000F03667A|nr:TniQ family protein [Pseudomonas viridiflava]
MSLIVQIKPYADESLDGFLRRASECNLAPSLKALLTSLGIRQKQIYSEQDFHLLAEALGIPESELAERQFAVGNFAAAQEPKFQARGSEKVCPQCLAENQYLRVGWNHILVTACPRHEIDLIKSCAACDLPITNHRHHLDRCDCGHAYASALVTGAANEVLAFSAYMSGVEHSTRQSLPEAWRTGSPCADAADLLCLLGKHLGENAEDTNNRRPGRKKSSAGDRTAHAQEGFRLLLEWPIRFDQAIATRLAATEGPGLAKRLGGWYRDLHTRFTDSAYDVLREALGQHLSANFDGHLNLRLSTIDPTHLQEKCWLTSEEAGRLIGIGSELVRSAVTTGEIDGKLTVRGKNRFVSIHKDVVERVRGDRFAHYDATSTRKQLGVSKVLFERLMQAGALRKQTKKERPPLVSGEFLVKDVEALIDRLTRSVSGCSIPEEQLIGLHDITVRRGVSQDRICSVLQKILALEIRPVENNQALHGLAGLRFNWEEIRDEVKEDQHEPLLTITELAKMRGWKHENIVRWIRQGLLKTVTVAHGDQLQIRIPLSSLLDFMAEYAVLADLANRTGTKSLWLLRALMPANVKAVAGDASGVQRGLLLSIDQLLAAAQWNKGKGVAQAVQAS